MKEFFKSPKKTAILGLVGSIGMVIYFVSMISSIFDIVTYLYILGFLIYFIIVLMRLYLQKGNIIVANRVLVITHITSLLFIVAFNLQYIFSLNALIYIAVQCFMILYFYNIFLKKGKLINNKLFAVIIIFYSIFNLCMVAKSISGFLAYRFSANFEIIAWAMQYFGYLLIIPYFYIYYELLKEEK